MIALITTNVDEFDAYCLQWNLDKTQSKQVARLSDIKNQKFTDIKRIQIQENVCDFVINKIKIQILETKQFQ